VELYIGGFAQGKLGYVLQKHQMKHPNIIDGAEIVDIIEIMGMEGDKEERFIFNHFHLWVKKLLEQGANPRQQIEAFLEKHPDCIIISDETGNGIVPAEQKEREYREQLGRILILLAAEAERVERVICGLGQRLK